MHVERWELTRTGGGVAGLHGWDTVATFGSKMILDSSSSRVPLLPLPLNVCFLSFLIIFHSIWVGFAVIPTQGILSNSLLATN